MQFIGLSTRAKTSLLAAINALANFQSLQQINLTWKCFLNEWKLQGLLSNTVILSYTTSNLIQVILGVDFSSWISISDFSRVDLKMWTIDSSWVSPLSYENVHYFLLLEDECFYNRTLYSCILKTNRNVLLPEIDMIACLRKIRILPAYFCYF